jgi:hypothetical protein
MITTALPPLDPPQPPSPDTPPATLDDTNVYSKFQQRQSSSSSSPTDDDETESESEPQLSRSSSTAPSTSEGPLWTPTDDYSLESRQWMLSAACEDEVKEWGQYLGEAAAADPCLSAPAAAAASS